MPGGHLHFLFGKMSVQFFSPFLLDCLGFLDAELYELFIYFGYQPPLVTKSLFSMSVSLFCFVNKFISIIFLDCTYKRYHIFVFLTSLSMTISRSIMLLQIVQSSDYFRMDSRWGITKSKNVNIFYFLLLRYS